MDNERYNAVICTAWVPRGAAKLDPEKVEVTKEELAKIIEETKQNLENLEEAEEGWEDVTEDDYEALEVEALKGDLKLKTGKDNDQDVEMKDESIISPHHPKNKKSKSTESDGDPFEKEYKFAAYDRERDNMELLYKLGKLAVHADNEADPNLTGKEDDSDSEKENMKILPTDNLITVGHIDGDAAILEVYVYNSEEKSLYIHHDVLLPSVPLCLEWLNFDPEDENLKPGNLVAVGSMSPIVEVWDLDLVDTLEPAFVLGRRAKKKKKISHMGHTDAVLSLAWNKHLEHILASGSVDKSIILWDLQKSKEAQKLTQFSDKVQDVKWHLTENHFLLSGSCDKYVRLFDCSTEEDCKTWKLDGEIECVTWDPAPNRSFNFYASTDTGSVYALDARQDKPLQRIRAHDKACTGMVMNANCPGCLVTVSEDKTVKIWDVLNPTKPKLVEETHPNLGVIHTISSSVDCPFVLSLGGDNKMNNFKVWDFRRSMKVRREFFDRLGLPINDDDEEDYDDAEVVIEDPDEAENYLMSDSWRGASAVNKTSKWKPPKKSKKKKGGHLDKKKWR